MNSTRTMCGKSVSHEAKHVNRYFCWLIMQAKIESITRYFGIKFQQELSWSLIYLEWKLILAVLFTAKQTISNIRLPQGRIFYRLFSISWLTSVDRFAYNRQCTVYSVVVHVECATSSNEHVEKEYQEYKNGFRVLKFLGVSTILQSKDIADDSRCCVRRNTYRSYKGQ